MSWPNEVFQRFVMMDIKPRPVIRCRSESPPGPSAFSWVRSVGVGSSASYNQAPTWPPATDHNDMDHALPSSASSGPRISIESWRRHFSPQRSKPVRTSRQRRIRDAMPIKVLKVGGGIAGLGAAIGFGRAGHHVEIFEKSSFSSEVGAALYLGPQAVHVLQEWGLDIASLRPNLYNAFKTISVSPGDTKGTFKDTAAKRRSLSITVPHLLAHRQDLHDLLRKAAVALTNVTLRLSCTVKTIDPAKGLVVLDNKDTFTGDLVIGADGTHAASISCIEALPQIASSKNMYRFMVPVEKAVRHAADVLREWDCTTEMVDFHDFGNDRSLIIYPCRAGTILNMVTIQPDQLDNAEFGDAWNNPGLLHELEDILRGYPERILELVRQAEGIRHWQEANRHCPSTFIKGRLVLIGNSAHPIKPYYAAGAATAIEDAAVLSSLFVPSRGDIDIDTCLTEYNDLRYARGVTIKYMSEPNDSAWDKQPREKMAELLHTVGQPEDIEEYLWTYDSFAAAAQV